MSYFYSSNNGTKCIVVVSLDQVDHIPSGALNPWVFSENTQYTLLHTKYSVYSVMYHAIVIDTDAGTTFAVISERSNDSTSTYNTIYTIMCTLIYST